MPRPLPAETVAQIDAAREAAIVAIETRAAGRFPEAVAALRSSTDAVEIEDAQAYFSTPDGADAAAREEVFQLSQARSHLLAGMAEAQNAADLGASAGVAVREALKHFQQAEDYARSAFDPNRPR